MVAPPMRWHELQSDAISNFADKEIKPLKTTHIQHWRDFLPIAGSRQVLTIKLCLLTEFFFYNHLYQEKSN